MKKKLKLLLFFPIARYFLFFAGIRLRRWDPTIIVVTGSNGKTTLLHILESQMRNQARYSHRANGMYGIAFHILDLKRKNLLVREWMGLFVLAPIRAFRKPPREQFYVVEADCDRPEEGRVIASFLRPDIVLWLSLSRTHTVNFDKLVTERKFENIETAVAYEFGYLLEYCSKLVIVNGDNKFILKQLKRTKAGVVKIHKKAWLDNYSLYGGKTEFVIKGDKYVLPFLLPEESFYSIAMSRELFSYLRIKHDTTFKHFVLPPGRSSLFKGVKGITIIDSTYNATPASVSAILSMYDRYKAKKKWVVLSDMIELGNEEREEHERLVDLLYKADSERILLMGPRMIKYVYDKLVKSEKRKAKNDIAVEKFMTPREVLDYLNENLGGGETVLFKGARFLEGVIEHLLYDKEDVARLPRREKIWEMRRKKWGI